MPFGVMENDPRPEGKVFDPIIHIETTEKTLRGEPFSKSVRIMLMEDTSGTKIAPSVFIPLYMSVVNFNDDPLLTIPSGQFKDLMEWLHSKQIIPDTEDCEEDENGIGTIRRRFVMRRKSNRKKKK